MYKVMCLEIKIRMTCEEPLVPNIFSLISYLSVLGVLTRLVTWKLTLRAAPRMLSMWPNKIKLD
jgi:hypothetical protein